MIKYNVDRLDSTIAGWIFDDESHEEFVVHVYLNGSFYQEIKANLYRKDLSDAGHRGNCAFHDDLKMDCLNFDGSYNIDLFATNSRNPPFLFHSASLSLSPPYKQDSSGWIFLTNDSNRIQDYSTGILRLSSSEIENEANSIISFFSEINSSSISNAIFVVPDKIIVCNPLRAEPLKLIPDRPMVLLNRALESRNFFRFYYLFDTLSQFPSKYYLKTDTHLSAQGYLKMIQEISTVVPSFLNKKISPKLLFKDNFIGELGKKYKPPISEEVLVYDYPSREHFIIYDDQIEERISANKSGTGLRAYFKKSDGPRRLMLFGSSSAYYLCFYLIEHFDEVLFIWGNPNFSDINEFKPNYLFWILPERYFPSL